MTCDCLRLCECEWPDDEVEPDTRNMEWKHISSAITGVFHSMSRSVSDLDDAWGQLVSYLPTDDDDDDEPRNPYPNGPPPRTWTLKAPKLSPIRGFKPRTYRYPHRGPR